MILYLRTKLSWNAGIYASLYREAAIHFDPRRHHPFGKLTRGRPFGVRSRIVLRAFVGVQCTRRDNLRLDLPASRNGKMDTSLSERAVTVCLCRRWAASALSTSDVN